jgi:hypothetical protein
MVLLTSHNVVVTPPRLASNEIAENEVPVITADVKLSESDVAQSGDRVQDESLDLPIVETADAMSAAVIFSEDQPMEQRERSMEQPEMEPVEEPVEQSTEEPVEESVEEPVEEPVGEKVEGSLEKFSGVYKGLCSPTSFGSKNIETGRSEAATATGEDDSGDQVDEVALSIEPTEMSSVNIDNADSGDKSLVVPLPEIENAPPVPDRTVEHMIAEALSGTSP